MVNVLTRSVIFERLGVGGGERRLSVTWPFSTTRRCAPCVRRPRRTGPRAPRDRARRRPSPGTTAACPCGPRTGRPRGSRPIVRHHRLQRLEHQLAVDDRARACRPRAPSRAPRRTAAAARPRAGRRGRASPGPTSPARRTSSSAWRTAASETSGCLTSVGSFCEPPCRKRRSSSSWVAPRETTRPGLPYDRDGAAVAELDGALHRALPDTAAQLVERRLHLGLVDRHLGVVVAAAGDHLPHPGEPEAASRRPPPRSRRRSRCRGRPRAGRR